MLRAFYYGYSCCQAVGNFFIYLLALPTILFVTFLKSRSTTRRAQRYILLTIWVSSYVRIFITIWLNDVHTVVTAMRLSGLSLVIPNGMPPVHSITYLLGERCRVGNNIFHFYFKRNGIKMSDGQQ